MARIPTYTAKMDLQGRQPNTALRPVAETENPVNQALSNLGANLQQQGQRLIKIQEQNEQISARKDLIDYETKVFALEYEDITNDKGDVVEPALTNVKGEAAYSGDTNVVSRRRKFTDDYRKTLGKKKYSRAVMADLEADMDQVDLRSTARLTEHQIKEREADQVATLNMTAEAGAKMTREIGDVETAIDQRLKAQKTLSLTSLSKKDKALKSLELDTIYSEALMLGIKEKQGSVGLTIALEDENVREMLSTKQIAEWEEKTKSLKKIELNDLKSSIEREKKVAKEAEVEAVKEVRNHAFDLSREGRLTEKYLDDNDELLSKYPDQKEHAYNMLKAQNDINKNGKKSIYEVTNKTLEAKMWESVYKDPDIFIDKTRPDHIDLWSFNTEEHFKKGTSIGFEDIKKMQDKALQLSKDKAVTQNTPLDSVLDELTAFDKKGVFWTDDKAPVAINEQEEYLTRLNRIKEKLYNKAKENPKISYDELKKVLSGELEQYKKKKVDGWFFKLFENVGSSDEFFNEKMFGNTDKIKKSPEELDAVEEINKWNTANPDRKRSINKRNIEAVINMRKGKK